DCDSSRAWRPLPAEQGPATSQSTAEAAVKKQPRDRVCPARSLLKGERSRWREACSAHASRGKERKSQGLDRNGGGEDGDTGDGQGNQKLHRDTLEAQQPIQPIACSI